MREVDGRHPASTDLPLDGVAVGGEAFESVGHRSLVLVLFQQRLEPRIVADEIVARVEADQPCARP